MVTALAAVARLIVPFAATTVGGTTLPSASPVTVAPARWFRPVMVATGAVIVQYPDGCFCGTPPEFGIFWVMGDSMFAVTCWLSVNAVMTAMPPPARMTDPIFPTAKTAASALNVALLSSVIVADAPDPVLAGSLYTSIGLRYPTPPGPNAMLVMMPPTIVSTGIAPTPGPPGDPGCMGASTTVAVVPADQLAPPTSPVTPAHAPRPNAEFAVRFAAGSGCGSDRAQSTHQQSSICPQIRLSMRSIM